MNAHGIPLELELLEALEALEALGLVDVEVNDLGELRVSPTQAGIAMVRDAAPVRAREEDVALPFDAIAGAGL